MHIFGNPLFYPLSIYFQSHFHPTLRATATQLEGRARLTNKSFTSKKKTIHFYILVHSGLFFSHLYVPRQPTPLRDAWSPCASLFSLQNKPQSHLQQSVWTHRSLTLVLRGWSLYLQTFTGSTDCWSTATPLTVTTRLLNALNTVIHVSFVFQ